MVVCKSFLHYFFGAQSVPSVYQRDFFGKIRQVIGRQISFMILRLNSS
jgi:hypothetical protein